MTPLLFLTPAKVEIAKEDVEVYESIFLPSGVSTAAFVQLMQRSHRKRKEAGQLVVKGGVPFGKVVLLLRGEAVALHSLEPDQNPE
ncbi:TMEM65, partial [Symbiodinium sp. CCMP2456]